MDMNDNGFIKSIRAQSVKISSIRVIRVQLSSPTQPMAESKTTILIV
jgi:hypothetical protein